MLMEATVHLVVTVEMAIILQVVKAERVVKAVKTVGMMGIEVKMDSYSLRKQKYHTNWYLKQGVCSPVSISRISVDKISHLFSLIKEYMRLVNGIYC
ncbi:hypothetical protein [Xenorhabdus japonica]|uniref:Uncharacterized protein n=1 Tax=Xenorhabdus japonica TaxID=53341 RepID=A0A1I5B0W8_9GAMM|nr:hypothetical protein [Xenorhabdus japonica]SFN68337.1 hypothetical protein SAMN05421579_1153 [Xenorhabdus japonica]